MDESQPLQPMNPYALGKVTNEAFARHLADRAGFGVMAFRLPHVTGEQHLRMVGAWPKESPAWFREQHDGIWTYVHDKDAAEAYALAIEQPRPGFEAYNIAAADIRYGTTPLRERLAGLPIDHWPPLPADWPDLAAPISCDKARQHFGWQPTTTFESLVAAAAAASTAGSTTK